VQLPPAVNVGDADPHGLDPPFKSKVKLVMSSKEIFDIFRLAVPLFLITTCRGAVVLLVVTIPKLYVDGVTCMEGDRFVPPDWLDPPPPPPPHPNNVMENSRDVINISFNTCPLIMNPPF